MLLVCVLYCLWGYFTFSICSSSSMGDLAVQDPQKFCFQRMLPLLQIYKCPCRAETVLQFRCLLRLIQLDACSIQAFCTSEQFLLFVVRNLFQTAAWDPSALDLPRISRAGVWLTGVLLTLM